MRIKNENIEDVYNLTPMQKGMVYYKLLSNESQEYIVQNSLHINGELDLLYVQKSLELLSIKYDVLRSSICLQLKNTLKQVILKNRQIQYTMIDLTLEDKGKRQEKIIELKPVSTTHRGAERRGGNEGCLFRIKKKRMASDRHHRRT